MQHLGIWSPAWNRLLVWWKWMLPLFEIVNCSVRLFENCRQRICFSIETGFSTKLFPNVCAMFEVSSRQDWVPLKCSRLSQRAMSAKTTQKRIENQQSCKDKPCFRIRQNDTWMQSEQSKSEGIEAQTFAESMQSWESVQLRSCGGRELGKRVQQRQSRRKQVQME